MSLILNLTADQGSSFEKVISLTDDNGLPLDVTGENFRAQYRKSYQSANLTDFLCTVTNTASGEVTISLTADVTRNAKPGRYVYDIEMYNTISSTVTRVREGQLEITPAASTPYVAVPNYPYRSTGHGSPEGVIAAPPGYSYIDLDTNTLYFKMTGVSTTGWQAFVQL